MSVLRNLSARCLDINSDRPVVPHKVDFEYNDSGVWVAKSENVMATDPQDAIGYIRKIYGD